MKFSSILSLSALTSLAAAHTYVWGIHINGRDMGRGDSYIRKVFNNDPVKDVKSGDMTCNKNHGPAARSLDVKGGDKIIVEWAHNNRGDDIIATSHKGPVQVYLASTKSSDKGPVWVKVASDGFSGGQWATDKLRANKGKHSFTMPHVNPGSYLIRPEIVALHEGNRVGGAQLYMVRVHSTCRQEIGRRNGCRVGT
jgi:cellulase